MKQEKRGGKSRFLLLLVSNPGLLTCVGEKRGGGTLSR